MREVDLHSFDLNLLVALDVLLREQHVSNSAKRLNISQPAMSRTLAKLRTVFNDQLLVRTPNGYIKTPRAEKLEKQLSETLRSVAKTIVPPQFDPASERAVFRICSLDYGEVVVVPELLKQLESCAPNVVVETVQRSLYSLQELETGAADVTLGIKPNGRAKNCKIKQLFEERYVCVMAKNHPLANQQLTLGSYLACGHSVTSTGSSTLRKIDQSLEVLGVRRRVVKRSPHFLGAIFSIQQTGLLHTTPMRHVIPLLEPLGLVCKELPFEMEPIRYCQIWHVRNDGDAAHKWFRDQISKAASAVASVPLPKL